MYMCIMAATSTWLAFRGEQSKKEEQIWAKKTASGSQEMHKQQDIPDSMLRSENKPLGKTKRTRESILGFLQGKCFPGKCHRVN